MKSFSELVETQRKEVAEELTARTMESAADVSGVLLTGSVARGDARLGPFGLMIDLTVVVEDKRSFSLERAFGPDEKPELPFHCVGIREKLFFALEALEERDLRSIDRQRESRMFAYDEAVVLADRTGSLREWKASFFRITDDQARRRALDQLSRFRYLTGEYRMEKWLFREAYAQTAQNLNEAVECYCAFLHCVNGRFVPRKDWLAYLSCGLPLKPEAHERLLESLYESAPDRERLLERRRRLMEAQRWMEAYCGEKGWA